MKKKMNALGAMTHEIAGMSLEESAAAMERLGLTVIQLDPRDPKIALGESLPSPQRAKEVKELFARHGITIVALAGYTNLVDPNLTRREAGLQCFEKMIELCSDFGTSYIATETGGLDPESSWLNNPLNHTQDAWEMLVPIVERLRQKAVQHGASVLIEGFVYNILSTTDKAAQLMLEIGTDGLGFVLDPFNYMQPEDFYDQEEAFARVFRTIARYSPIAHAKDAIWEGDSLETPKVGDGLADWTIYTRLLRKYKPDAPLIMEHLTFNDIEGCQKLIVNAYEKGVNK